MRTLSPTLARRLAIACQRLSGPRPPADAADILEVVRDLGCLQLDPTSAVARSHLLVLWSRLGRYDPALLDALLWRERALFEYWAHAASIVPTEDYPIHHLMMRRYARGEGAWPRRVRAWMEQNGALRDAILAALVARGPLLSRALPDVAAVPWASTGWTASRNVERMLAFLWAQGEVLVAGRRGSQRLWTLAERHLPTWTPRAELAEREVVRRAALRALGVATPAHIAAHYTRDRYPGLDSVLAELEGEGRIVPVAIGEGEQALPGRWYVHADDLPALERLAAGEWRPRTTLLSPFDNLICDRARTETLFGFAFRLEIYVPRARRRYGYFVMPILYGDRLIGRIDPLMDRTRGHLTVNAVYAEPAAPASHDVARAVAAAVEDLGLFLGARDIVYSAHVPEAWAQILC